jgi:hypothetical protein
VTPHQEKNVQPVDPQFAMLVVVVGLSGLVSLGSGISTIIANSRRKPPLDQEVYQNFVRRQELETMRAQFNEQMRALDDRHQKSAAEIFNVLRALQRDIGSQSTRIELSLAALSKELGEIGGRVHGHIEGEKRK